MSLFLIDSFFLSLNHVSPLSSPIKSPASTVVNSNSNIIPKWNSITQTKTQIQYPNKSQNPNKTQNPPITVTTTTCHHHHHHEQTQKKLMKLKQTTTASLPITHHRQHKTHKWPTKPKLLPPIQQHHWNQNHQNPTKLELPKSKTTETQIEAQILML